MPSSLTARTEQLVLARQQALEELRAPRTSPNSGTARRARTRTWRGERVDSDSNANSASVVTVGSAEPELIVVSGTTAVVAVAIAKADRLPGSPQIAGGRVVGGRDVDPDAAVEVQQPDRLGAASPGCR